MEDKQIILDMLYRNRIEHATRGGNTILVNGASLLFDGANRLYRVYAVSDSDDDK